MENRMLHLFDSIVSFEDTRKDYLIPRKDIKFSFNNGFQVVIEGFLFDPYFNISSFALGQLCTMLEIPASYIRKCPPILKVTNLQYWNDRYSKKQNVRVCASNNDVIGIVTASRYTPYTYKEFLDDVTKSLANIPSLLMGIYSVDHTCLDFNMVLHEMSIADDYSDGRLAIGIHCRNSEVGHDSANVSPIMYNTATNTLIPLGGFMLQHKMLSVIHVSKNNGISVKLTDNFNKMLEYLNDNYTNILDIVRTSGNYIITVKNLRKLMKDNMLNQDVIDSEIGFEIFANDIPLDKEVNFRVVINAISSAASKKSYPGRWELEKVAGKLLSEFQGVSI